MADQTLSAFSKLTYFDGEEAIDKVFKFISAKKTYSLTNLEWIFHTI